MRKIFKSFMLVAAAAMTFASCQREELNAPKETVSATLTMHAGVEQTKTYLDGNAVLWGTGEAVTLYVGTGVGDNATAMFVSSDPTDIHNGAKTASFTFTLEGVPAEGPYSLGGIYPASAAIKDNKNASQFKVTLPATQNQVEGNYDPSAYIMVLKPEVVTELPTEYAYTALFRRAVALNKITLTGVKENISSVEITVPEKKYLAGRRYMNLTTGESGDVYYDQSNKVIVNSSFTGNSIDVWFTSWGVELAEGDELTIKMTAASKTYTRTIAARAEGIKFVEGDLNTLTVNMSSATEETLDNFSGEYLIVNTDLTRAAQAWANGNNLPEFVLNARDGVVYESEGIENCKMTIEAQADGKYTIKDANGLYLYAASSSSNHLMGQTTASSWTIEQDGDKYVLTSSAQTSHNIMKYNAQSKIFSCYSSGQKDITLYKYSDIKVDTTPSISLTNNSAQVAFDATSYEFTYTTKNITGNVAATIKEGATMTNVSASASDGTVTVTFDANADAKQKTAIIVLSYEGAESVNVTITQAAKPAEGAPEEVTDVLTLATTGVSGTGYTDWSGKTVTSSAVYAGQSAGDKSSIQLRSKNSNSGVVTTVSGGYARKIVVQWNSSTTSGRTLDIYGKNTAYTAATDLYNSTGQGTKLGSITYGTSTELVITGAYQYIGLRSADGAMYLSKIAITWSSEAGSGETPVEPIKLTMSEIDCSAQTENSLTFTWTTVANATGYEVTCNNKTETVTKTQYEVTGLTASTSYTVSIVAKGDGINYTDSESKTQTGTTKDAQQPGGGDEGDDQGGTEYVKVTSATPGPGTYLYVLDKGYVFTGDVSDNSWGKSASVTISNEKIIATEELNAYAITLEEGSTSGQYAVKLPNGKYLQTSTSKPSSNTTKKYMTYDLIEGLRSVDNADYYFHANASSGNKFRWYKLSSNQVAGQLYKLN